MGSFVSSLKIVGGYLALFIEDYFECVVPDRNIKPEEYRFWDI